ncbi:MAG: HFX_2341 family transcriptional regulator domain-containing protein [Promethearchaeota archaeon]
MQSTGLISSYGRRVHIIFIDRELERFMAPIRDFNPQKIYVFVYESTERDVNFKLIFPKLKEEIKNFNKAIEIIIKEIKFTDYFKVIQELSKIIKEERKIDKNTKILINCSTGSKMSAVACIDASRLWNVDVIYVYSDDFQNDRQYKHMGKMKIIIPPIFPVTKPSWKEIETLRLINNMINEYIEEGEYEDPEDEGYILRMNLQDKVFKEKILRTDGKKDIANKRSRESTAFKDKILKPLYNKGYIRIEKYSKTQKIYLTEEGRRIAEVFKYYNPKNDKF